jgi:hypothetical protein
MRPEMGGSAMLIPPTPGARVSQRFGENPAGYAPYGLAGHEGVDFAVAVGTPIRAAHSGVAYPLNSPTYGRAVSVVGDPYTTLYAHLSQVAVTNGQGVAAGEVIGLSGNTGRSTGPHLHFGLKIAGVANAPFKNWVDPLNYLTGEAMSKLGFHIQRPIYPAWLKAHVKESGATWVKLMDPDQGEIRPFGERVNYVARLWWANEPDRELVWQGAAGAEQWMALARPRLSRAWWVTGVEGPNEPTVQTTEQARLWAAFETRRVELLHVAGFRAVSGCFSTGCPPLELWPVLGTALAQTDYLALHEYGMKRMALDGWHLLRYRQVISRLRQAGQRVPPLLITETGIDYGGDPQHDGWRAQGLSEEQYLSQLRAYDAELAQDDLVLAATPFTWQDAGWPSFAIDESLSRRIATYMQAQVRRDPLPEDETAADGPTLRQKVRWWAEEALRQYEAGNKARFEAIMYNLVRVPDGLMYWSEQAN